MANGKLKYFNYEKGFGFILLEGSDKEIFFHQNDIISGKISDHCYMQFDTKPTTRDRKAVNIKIK